MAAGSAPRRQGNHGFSRSDLMVLMVLMVFAVRW